MATTTSVSSSGNSLTVSGLGSGLDTAGIVDSLIAIESNSQTKLKNSLASHQSKVTAYQNLNSAFTAIKTASQDLSLGVNWKQMTAQSSSASVSTTTTSAATAGTFSFSVQNLAKAHTMVTSGSVSSLSTAINSSGESLTDVVARINGSNSGYTAAAVQVSAGNYKLQLQSANTGVANAITANPNEFSSAMGSLVTVQPATDATIKVGEGTNAYTITSGSNKAEGILPGVTMNLLKADPTELITVTVGADADAMAAKVKAMVSSINDAVSFIKTNSAYNASTKQGGVFLGNSTTRRLQSDLHNALTDVVNSTIKLGSSVGIESKSDGTFTFDTEKFTAAFKANPEDVSKLFVEGGTTSVTTGNNPGIAERLNKLAKSATDSVSGMITTSVKGETSTIADLNKAISAWDDRLAKRRETLTRMYNAMDNAMSNFSGTGSWLSNAINGLASNSGK